LELDLDPLALLENKFSINICCRGELNNILLDMIPKNNNGVYYNHNMFDPVDYKVIDNLIAKKERY
ncbi:MAG: hypothetical protein KJ864_02765, partial [Candidatus Omnitrophica bacterium]|nr:hypothetical protein [Candidatus Omnitrophota bacterium]